MYYKCSREQRVKTVGLQNSFQPQFVGVSSPVRIPALEAAAAGASRRLPPIFDKGLLAARQFPSRRQRSLSPDALTMARFAAGLGMQEDEAQEIVTEDEFVGE